MPMTPTAPAAPDPDDRDEASDFVTEDQLRDQGIDPVLVRATCPWAAELTALDGSRCWCRADLAPLLEGN